MARKILGLVLVLLCIIGLADVLFIYAQEEKGTIGQFCESLGGAFGANCEKVLTSKYAEVAGLPLTVWGILYYLSLVWMSVWARVEGSRAARLLLAATSGAGFLVSAYLTYLQGSVLKAWCPFCLVSAADTTLITMLSIWASAPVPSRAEIQPQEPGGEVKTEVSSVTGILIFICVLLASGLSVALLYRTPERAQSTLEDMMRFVPRRTTPPGGLQYGMDTAPVTVQAFLDYTCQHCRTFESDVFPKIHAGYIETGRVKWINKVLPHSDQGAPIFFSMSGICGRSFPDSAAIERAFFAYPVPSPKTGFDALADALQAGGVSAGVADAVRVCVQSQTQELQQKVLIEVQQAFSYGLKGPPAFVIDGIAYQGSMDYRTLSDLLDIYLKQRGQ